MANEQARELMVAMRRWLRAEREREKAIRSCREDASYFCHREIQEEEDAMEAVAETLTAFVDSRLNSEN
jgi:hypothetical protein